MNRLPDLARRVSLQRSVGSADKPDSDDHPLYRSLQTVNNDVREMTRNYWTMIAILKMADSRSDDSNSENGVVT